MSSFPTTPAFIATGDWNAASREHPAMKWMEDHVQWWDSREWIDNESSLRDWVTPDYTLHLPDGTLAKGIKDAHAALKALYGPLTAYHNDPSYAVTTETADGWEMLGQAWLYADLPGEPAKGEAKVTDSKGKHWDIRVPGAFHFWYVKDENAGNGGGLLISREEMVADSGVAMGAMLKRGLISAKDLGL